MVDGYKGYVYVKFVTSKVGKFDLVRLVTEIDLT